MLSTGKLIATGAGFFFFLLTSLATNGQQAFTEVASSINLDLDRAKDGGFSFGYLNDDDYLDLIVNTKNSTNRSRVYFNDGPPNYTYTDVTATNAAGLLNNTLERSAIIADFNNDGYNDIMRNTARRFELYLNKGPNPADGDVAWSFGDASQNPDFELYTSSTGDTNPANGVPGGMNIEGIGAIDFDNDGDLDIMLENHNYGIDLYENVGFATGTFVHATPNASPMGLPTSAGDGDYASVTDINNDGYIDIVARKRNAEDFYLNTRSGNFRALSTCNRQASNSNKGAVSLQDFDNDGDLDMMWTESDSNMLFINDRNSYCVSSGEPWISSGINDPYVVGDNSGIDGLATGDIDNDGDVDMFLADDSGPSYLFINQLAETGSLSFVRSNLGINVNADAEGCSFVDYDNDGDLDLYININGADNQMWENNLNTLSAGSNYLAIRVLEDRDASGNPNGHAGRSAIGATVQLMDCDGNYITGLKEVNGGNGHGTQGTPVVHFGLPNGPSASYIVMVRYPVYNGVRTAGAQLIVPSDSSGYTIDISPTTWDVVASNDAPTGTDDHYTLASRVQTVEIDVMGNDSDINADAIQIQSVHGLSDSTSVTIVDAAAGRISYTYSGSRLKTLADTFQYVINDDASCAYSGQFDTVTVVIERPSTVLAASWLAVSATQEGSTNRIAWETTAEVDCDHYRVMRSADAVTYEAVGTVAANNRLDGINYYSLADAKPFSGGTYYKVIEVDKFGVESSSEIVYVEAGLAQDLFSVYPNPSNGLINVQLASNISISAYTVRSITGQVVRHAAVDANAETLQLDLTDLAQGTYMLETLSGNSTGTQVLIIE